MIQLPLVRIATDGCWIWTRLYLVTSKFHTMKSVLLSISILLFCTTLFSQSTDKEGVKAACQDYIDAFYLGDTLALKRSFSPHLNKFGYWKDDKSGEYAFEGYMTYEQALTYSRNVGESKKYPSPNAPKEIEILDVMNHIACAKITAWWGVDYIQLSHSENTWTIQQVIWEGPLEK